jgi:hypothetical protein
MPKVLTRVETMDEEKRKRLEAAGWKTGTAAEFFGLTKEEEAIVNTRLEHERLRAAVVEAAKAYGLAARAVEDHMKKSNDADDDSAAGWQLLRDMESKQEDLLLESVWPLIAFEAEHKIGGKS